MSASITDKQLLIGAMEAFLADPNLDSITLGPGVTARISWDGDVQQAELHRDGLLVTYAPLRQGDVTIADKDPDWRLAILEADV